MKVEKKKYPEGHFVGMYIALGVAVFTALGLYFGSTFEKSNYITIGPVIGVLFGVIVGRSIESKYKQEGRIRCLTDKEKNRKKILVLIGVLLLFLGFILFFSFLG
ncbi:MAG: hypothetical protein DRJ01_01250 [Bacteroidetes bacterium]|nr:MAG: hypothetical protein DRJ01_01250 [Bacteroidota bacterium]